MSDISILLGSGWCLCTYKEISSWAKAEYMAPLQIDYLVYSSTQTFYVTFLDIYMNTLSCTAIDNYHLREQPCYFNNMIGTYRNEQLTSGECGSKLAPHDSSIQIHIEWWTSKRKRQICNAWAENWCIIKHLKMKTWVKVNTWS